MKTHNVKVLYAEDNEDSGNMLRTLLGFSDIRVAVIASVDEAIETARTDDFDLYLLDGKFRDGSGTELCRRLREIEPEKPVVFYSASAFKTDRQSAMDAGASAYIVKPDADSVAPTILQLVGRSAF